jgi:outer membrane protein OmpA-like peptidoglycan-associated protein
VYLRYSIKRPLLLKLVSILFLIVPFVVVGQSNPKPLYSKVVYFGFNQWDIEKGEEKTLLAVVRAIKAQKNPYYINLTGYTDNVDNDKYNYQLGLKRAHTVAAYLIKRGADSAQVFLFSKGEAQSKKTDADSLRRLDRRVEIQLFSQIAPQTTPPKTDSTRQIVQLQAQMIDSVTGEAVKGQILIVNNGRPIGNNSLYLLDTQGFVIPVYKNDQFAITYAAKGYRTKNITYNISTDAINPQTQTVSVIARLIKVNVKSKKSFEKIYFYGNEARFLPSSGDELKRLLAFAQVKDVNAIEIVGHVNYPLYYNQNDTIMMKHNFWLSNSRAQAVYNYLVDNGISPNIITYKGVGNTEMKYPNTRDENEMAKNRRVEVLILEEVK